MLAVNADAFAWRVGGGGRRAGGGRSARHARHTNAHTRPRPHERKRETDRSAASARGRQQHLGGSALPAVVSATMPATAGCARLKPTAPDVGLPSSCAALSSPLDGFKRQQCVGSRLAAGLQLTQTAGLQEASSAAVCLARHLVNANMLDDCHLVAHAIGRALWQRYAAHHAVDTSTNLAHAAAELVPQCPSMMCVDGCVHALMIELLRASLPLEHPVQSAQAIVNVACSDATLAIALGNSDLGNSDEHRSRWRYACYHGVGHGLGALAFAGDFEVPYATGLCATLAPEMWQYACSGGLPMELADSRLQRVINALPPAARLNATRASPFNASMVTGVCAGFTEARTRSLCYNTAGEGLMFASCHHLSMAKAACGRLGSNAEALQACNTGAHEEAEDVNFSNEQTGALCRAPAANYTARLYQPCFDVHVHERGTPLHAWCCETIHAEGFLPAGVKGAWTCPPTVSHPPAGGKHVGSTATPIFEDVGGLIAIVLVLCVGMVVLWRRRRYGRFQTIGTSLRRVQSARWQAQGLVSDDHKKYALKYMKARPGSVQAMMYLRKMQMTGHELGATEMEPTGESPFSSPPLSPLASPAGESSMGYEMPEGRTWKI